MENVGRTRRSALRTFEHRSEIWLPRSRDEVFPFFAEARNLERLTPPWLRFEVVTPPPIVMAPGARIDYRLRIHGVPIRWQSEISDFTPPLRFVDEQRRGPYRFWHHTHEFEARDGGTLVRDRVRYAVPGGWLIWKLVVERDVAAIFGYRERVLREIFAGPADAALAKPVSSSAPGSPRGRAAFAPPES